MSNWTVEEPRAAAWNASSLDLAEITMDRNFALLLAALSTAVLWLTYITYYNSRVLGFMLTRLINKFYFQHDNFKIGSITLHALSGKIMFRDIVYINYDYTVRVQDGYLIFRWWRSYVPKDVSEDLSHSDTRLSLVLNGFELHVYNRCFLYSELERTFGLDPSVGGGGWGGDGGDGGGGGGDGEGGERAMNEANDKRRRAGDAVRAEAALARTWRDLIPVIKCDVCSARVVFGNRLVPTTLSLAAEEAHLLYSTKPPASSLDHLMHFVKAKADNCKVILAPSPNYTAMVDEPPRFMGEGFVVMSSNYIEVYLYMDEPGLVPERPVLLRLANGDVVESAPPIWGVDIKCGKGTDFSYGPWADRQRDHLFRFFFPPDYKSLEVTPQPKPGDRRQMQSFDIRLSTLNEATIDILFTKNKETNAVHINIGAGSYLEVTLPWIVLQDGYTTKITGQLLHLEATTSLQYRSLAESETLEYTVKCHYPLVWNHHQCWQLSLTGCKATTHLVYTHVDFFQDLVNDWASKARPDILHFIPYTWKISLLLKECEVVTVSNQYNWIDCSSTNQENSHVAFCGDLLDVSFDLPFIDFLPDIIPLKIWIQGEAVDMSLYLPEVSTSRLLLLSIDKNMKLIPCRLKASKWRRRCVKSQGWVDCWSVPIVALSVRYDYHPIPPLGPEPQADITTPEKEEILLSPMRIPRVRKQPQMKWATDGTKFDRTALAPDRVSVELEVGPSVLLAYGTIITGFMNLLENIFGEDQTFTDMARAGGGEGGAPEAEREPLDPRRCRPLDVHVSITLHDVQAHLVKHCSDADPPCPIVLVERFGFEMDKSFRETKLQVLLSPSVLVSTTSPPRAAAAAPSGPLYQGHLMLSSLQLRGHGMFSDVGRAADEDTLEYAWLLELQLGQLSGRLTLPQLYQVGAALETFALLVSDAENELSPPDLARRCHHGLVDVQCPESQPAHKYRCPTADEIKYRMVRVAVDLLDVYVVDAHTALQVWASPARLAYCNLHGAGAAGGLTALVPALRLALYTARDNDVWLGAGGVQCGPLLLELAAAPPPTPPSPHQVQQRFLRLHDEPTKRLSFLWPADTRAAHCGCLGGCVFFGSNRNGPAFLRPSAADAADNVNVASFHVLETAGEYGYGQSLLHAGQLVFHTPPYGRHVRLRAPPSPPRPAPPTPRPARGEVPYARLVDSAPPPHEPRPRAAAPQLESSVSDSRLALRRGPERAVAGSDSHHSLDSQPPPPLEGRRTMSITSENHSEAFFSADEELFPSRSSSLKHPVGRRRPAPSPQPPPPPEPPAPAPPAPAPPDEESGSVSSTSFISAISSQEDMTLVDLHMQTNRPIVDSPLLMASYSAHLPQYRCNNWASCSLGGGGDAFTVPLFRRGSDGTLVYAGRHYVPRFEPLQRADTPRLRARDGPVCPRRAPQAAPARAHPVGAGWWEAHAAPTDEEEDEPAGARLAVALSARGEIHALLTPLVLESAQRFVEALTPVLAGLHPGTVLTHLRLLCVSSVQDANVLKQRRYVANWLPVMQARERAAPGDDRCRLATIPPADVYEEVVVERLQASVALPRLNVVFLQSSVVEDVISFSALDDIQDLTCVSLCGVAVEGLTARAAWRCRRVESVQLYYRPALRALSTKKSFGIMKGARGGGTRRPERGEPVYIETTQQLSHRTAANVNIGKIHCQLRRLRNESSTLKDATITGIPNNQSRVSFKFIRAEPCPEDCDGSCVNSPSETTGKDNAMGYIMVECGVEGVGVKVSRRAASAADEAPAEDEAAQGRGEAAAGVGGRGEVGEGAPEPDSEPETPRAAPPAPAAPPADASSCAVDLKSVWFNFAAPPRTPITGKIDYTRLDWNLLSTASPAISAWMNPCNRLGIRVVALYRAQARRLAATAACLMAGALDLAPSHTPPKSRYGRHTAMARQLREEPSLQLCGVLLRHALGADAAAVQADLAERHLPSLSTLRQGVIVLTRQWKNILYTPLLLEQGNRSKVLKPLNVTFALPDLLEQESSDWVPLSANSMSGSGGAGGGVGGEAETVDESCELLGGSRRGGDQGDDGGEPQEDTGEAEDLRRDDLYQWMASQQPTPAPRSPPPPSVGAGSSGAPAAGGASAGASRGNMAAGSLYPVGGAAMLLDAHLVFRPLLSALGVAPAQVGAEGTAALDALGSRLSLLAWVDQVRVDIVVGELGARRSAHAHAAQPTPTPAPSDGAAFICEKVCLDVDVRRVADVAVGELVSRRNVLYISRGQLKKHISTQLNFNLGVRFISQQVNMPLLRLLHQISTMYQNVKDTQVELRGQSDLTQRGEGPPSSSVSDFRENLVSVSSLERSAPGSVLGSRCEWEGEVPPPTPTPAPVTPTPTPAPAKPTRPRPQSFAQKLRSTGKTVKGKLGYSSLSEGAHTPMFPAGGAAPVSVPVAPPGAGAPSLAPRCWRTLYLLLELYANMPDADTITHRFSVATSELGAGADGSLRARRGAGGAGGGGAMVTGVARIHRTRLLASLSGLKLEGELTALHAALAAGGGARPRSLTGTLGRATVALLEGQAQVVVRASVGKSQALHSWEAGGRGGGAAALLSVGGVRVDLPQHPVALHGVMTRSSRQLSSTLQELGVGRTRRPEPASPPPPPPPPPTAAPRPGPRAPPLQFSLAVASLSVTAALLPSLQAQYKMEQVSGSGVTGGAAHVTLELPRHSLSFVTRLRAAAVALPAAAEVALPAVQAVARLREAGGGPPGPPGAVLRKGRYVAATADIGVFDHTLSTDLLNHLVFVQKVFMKEVNEVVQKVSGGEKPVPLWADEAAAASPLARALFTLVIRIQRIQLTATTPSNSAVRLETGRVELELSNRVANVPAPAGGVDPEPRLFARAQVDLNLSLGQLIRNAMFDEAEPEFQQYAFFNTRISMRNAFQEEACGGSGGGGDGGGGGDVVVIRLRRPLVYVQPVAVDRAILVWLNYKNAYEYWNEKRRSLNTEVLAATQQLMEKVQLSSVQMAPHLGPLFVQLDVDDVGVCLPLQGAGEGERGALVLTLESTSVSACSGGALVSKGRFVGLCVRFAADFEASLDDWRPRPDESALNVCCVSEGTYEVCSRTTQPTHTENAKWFLNVSWQMEGVDIHLDVSVGKQLSALGHTLTMLTGFEEEDPLKVEFDSDFDDDADNSKGSQESIVVRRKTDHLPAFVFDGSLDARQRSKLIESEMNEQAKIINDLRALGASHSTIEHEMRRLHDLEALVFKDFRRDMIQKLRRQSVKAGGVTRGQLGLGGHRSQSFVSGNGPPGPPRLADIGEGGPARSASLRGDPPPRGVQRQASLPAPPEPEPEPDDEVELRRKPALDETAAAKGKGEPNVDFELDVKVHVNSGKCVLHTGETSGGGGGREEERRRAVGRSASGGLDAGSPQTRRKRPPPPDVSVFLVPGLHLRLHYESRTTDDAPLVAPLAALPAAPRKPPSKKAALFAWITLQSIPEETVVSPHILEFLERALDPLPPNTFAPPPPPPPAEGTEGTEEEGAGSYGQYVYASFPVDVIVHFHMQPSTFRFSCLPASRVECLLQLPSLQIVFSSKRATDEELAQAGVAMGGLSVTGCLADFSVYMFHPYGGKKSSLKEAQWSPLADTERKDSLSINVEFVKFHLSRSRKLDFQDSDHSKATVRFSTIVDVGSAWFKYDMRRLGEILAFPKAWYRRTIVRRMFLGDLSAQSQPAQQNAKAGGPVSPVLPPRERSKSDIPRVKTDKDDKDDTAWETLVLFAVNFTKLNVHMNMGNVMGNVSWQSRDFTCSGRLSIGSTGHRNMLLGVTLASSALDARGGIVGGAISLSAINTYAHISEEPGGMPLHVCGVRLAALELRLEYMGSGALLARVSRLHAAARDEWLARRPALRPPPPHGPPHRPPPRPAIILTHGTLAWHQLQLLMSRSTTPDLLKMQLKLEEFFTQQFKSSRRVFSALHPEYGRRAERPADSAPSVGAGEGAGAERRHHRHWQRALRQLAGMQLCTLSAPLPADGMVLGGTVELHGANVSLACFHGTGFKAKSWALFSLKEPCISFATEAQQLANDAGELEVHVVQSLTAGLGLAQGSAGGHQSMATVCRMTRTVLFPPQFKTLNEWFHYAFANSEIDAIDSFPSLERETNAAGAGGGPGGAAPAEERRGARGGGGGGGGGAADHTREVIFALPSLQLHLRTQHKQAPTPPDENDPKPVVECSFITEFEDHIFVSVDAEAFLFLHDLISSYIKEKERVMPGMGGHRRGEAPAQDYRDYRCVTWHLEPTVRLLSWAGKSIEPYGVDYILQKLGFRHARVTIPKWLQRGALDPLDTSLALLLRSLAGIVPRR